MSLHDPIADLLTRLRNASKAKLSDVMIPYSTLKHDMVNLLLQSGYIKEVYVIGEKIKTIKVVLKYKGRISALTGLKQISKPGLRVYAHVEKLPKVLNGLGVAIVSTSQGVLTDKQARLAKIGGEVLAYVW